MRVSGCTSRVTTSTASAGPTRASTSPSISRTREAASPPHASASDTSRKPRRRTLTQRAARRLVARARPPPGRPPRSPGDSRPAPGWPAPRSRARGRGPAGTLEPARERCAAPAARRRESARVRSSARPRPCSAALASRFPSAWASRPRSVLSSSAGAEPSASAADRHGATDASRKRRRSTGALPAGARRPPRATSRSASPAQSRSSWNSTPSTGGPEPGSRRQLWQTSPRAVAAPRSSCSAQATRSRRPRSRWIRANRRPSATSASSGAPASSIVSNPRARTTLDVDHGIRPHLHRSTALPLRGRGPAGRPRGSPRIPRAGQEAAPDGRATLVAGGEAPHSASVSR